MQARLPARAGRPRRFAPWPGLRLPRNLRTGLSPGECSAGLSVRHTGGGAKKFHHRCSVAVVAAECFHDVVAVEVGMSQICYRDKVLALEIVDQRVIGRETPWRALERGAGHAEAARERARIARPAPFFGTVRDRAADIAQRHGIRVPQPDADENLFGIDVEVIAGCVHITATLVPELDAEAGLVRTLVGRESRIAVDSHH